MAGHGNGSGWNRNGRREDGGGRSMPVHLRPRKALHVDAPAGLFETQMPRGGIGRSLNYSSIAGYNVLLNAYEDPRQEARALEYEARQPRRGRKAFAMPRTNPLGADLDAPPERSHAGSRSSGYYADTSSSGRTGARPGGHGPVRSRSQAGFRATPSGAAPLLGQAVSELGPPVPRSASRNEPLNPYAKSSYKYKYQAQAYNPLTHTYTDPSLQAASAAAESDARRRKAESWQAHRSQASPERARRRKMGISTRDSSSVPGSILAPAPPAADRVRHSAYDPKSSRWRAGPPQPAKTRPQPLLQSAGVSSALRELPPRRRSSRPAPPQASKALHHQSTIASVLAYSDAPMSAQELASYARPSRKTGPREVDRGYSILAHDG
ncbi:uncharacterized protein AMSG_04919 [Thecamonas trahens ATCC 50062]|uniref:Uncharacterized protein n=1 Tax=Thecamonas trahens ATCC 50062 TaxID=461836 RepID=A0A0L0D8R2_THETB|nr:hypothetical protein AMSG_04919 [Thecamonas trahens ATCC 50062]KNC48471.1 hypothetical protein AMSG_04919 [Thecamonas trahens ATCC 50062]|eukprot:XP_013758583.1 hypothetical protein AMSG_04919 [Thecamonas trahens ATCC 50062]